MDRDFLKRGYQGRRVLVTGHTGFKGSWLCSMLLSLGARIAGCALAPEEPALYPLLKLEERMDSFYGDIRDRESLARILRETAPEVVFHLAAQPIVRASYEEPADTYEVNLMGTVNLLEAVRHTPSVRSVIIVTTDKVYRNDESGRAFAEGDPLGGGDPYSNSKSCAELAAESYRLSFLAEKGVAVSTVRAGNVIGGGDFGRDRILPDCVRAVSEGEPVIVRNPGSVRPYQHVTAPLLAYLRLALLQEENRALSGAYNIGACGQGMETLELVKLFCRTWNERHAGAEASWIIRPDGGPSEAFCLRLDTKKAEQLGLLADPLPVEDAVEETVEFARLYRSGGDPAAHVTDWIERALQESKRYL